MSKKIPQDQPADDWAGLAQNLFGINLDKGTGDDDLLDDDMFKVELPKPPEPPVLISQSDVEFAPAAQSEPAPPPAVSAKPAPKVPLQRVVQAAAKVEDDPFGVGIVEESTVASNMNPAASIESPLEFEDAGLTLPEDFDAEGLTLPADYDDGLTLAPEAIAVTGLVGAEDDEEDEASDTEVLPADHGEIVGEGASESRRRRHPRRTREDAYWDMLENWEWEEIPEDDSPRGEGERSRSSRGDRGDRRGRRGDRGRRDRGRDEQPRSESRSPVEDQSSRAEQRPAEAAPMSGSDSGERQRRPRRGERSRDGGDRPRDDRGPREDRPRGERRPERGDRRHDEPRRAAPVSPPPAAKSTSFDDFGSGIFEAEPQSTSSSMSEPNDLSVRYSPEEFVAQSSQAADAVLRSGSPSSNRSIADELVWPEDDSDVRLASAGSVIEPSGLPPADAAGESDETISASDVEPLEEDDEALRPRRRRRRRREPHSESRTYPPDGNEGTTFDLSDALATDSESPDFIPSAVAEDSADGQEAAAKDSEGVAEEDRSPEQRGGRRRRRRRRRPGEEPSGDATSRPARESSAGEPATETDEASDEEDYVVKPITYSNIPSWEEAIRYLLQPHLVGRNLTPDDADESLENDPRGSGGAEPTPTPPPPRRRGGGRGRRHGN